MQSRNFDLDSTIIPYNRAGTRRATITRCVALVSRTLDVVAVLDHRASVGDVASEKRPVHVFHSEADIVDEIGQVRKVPKTDVLDSVRTTRATCGELEVGSWLSAMG